MAFLPEVPEPHKTVPKADNKSTGLGSTGQAKSQVLMPWSHDLGIAPRSPSFV